MGHDAQIAAPIIEPVAVYVVYLFSCFRPDDKPVKVDAIRSRVCCARTARIED